jgi:hypothetical protein
MLPIEDRELLTQAMVGLNVDPETIATLMASFDIAAEHLEGDPIAPVPDSSFGGSYTGGHRLATNAQMAHDAVAAELTKMAEGLRGMGQVLTQFKDDVVTTTEQTRATMQMLQAATDCVSAPTFDSQPCSLPTGSED